jgi:hypothetical protein
MKGWILITAFGFSFSSPVLAHHSIAGAYDTGREVRIEGLVTEFQFVNPHPFLVVEVRDDNGETRQWRLEMDNRVELLREGMRR